MGIDVDVWEMTKIYGEIAYVFDKWLNKLGINIEIWEIAKIFGNWLRYMGQCLSI